MANPNHLLRTARETRHWSQQVLAYKLNATRITINRWEQGKSFPSPHFRALLCSVFGMTESELGLKKDYESKRNLSRWFLPFPRNLFFTGREQILQHLYTTFQSKKRAALAQVQTISGLGGIGKTQTAIEYAYRFRDCYTTVLWIKAETHDTLVKDIMKLAVALNILRNNQQQIVHAFTTWLRTHSHWLLILDGVKDMTLAHNILPSDFNGHVILTTQSQTTGPFPHYINLDEMSPEEGSLFLLRRAKLIDYDKDVKKASQIQQAYALQLSHTLGGHPLALDQASAFIEETGCSLSDYLKYFQHHTTALLNFRVATREQHHFTTFTTISLALEHVKRISPPAVDLLCLSAFLHPDAIPEEIFYQPSVHPDPILQSSVVDPFALDATFAILRTHSLLNRDKDTYLLSIHRLVQVVLKEHMSQEEKQIWTQRALQAVHRLFPLEKQYENPAIWPLCDLLLPHVLTILEHIETILHSCLDEDSSIIRNALLHKAICYLNTREDHIKAEKIYRCGQIHEQTHTTKYPRVKESLTKLEIMHNKHINDTPISKEALMHYRVMD